MGSLRGWWALSGLAVVICLAASQMRAWAQGPRPLSMTDAPEPSSLVLLGMGAAIVFAYSYRRGQLKL